MRVVSLGGCCSDRTERGDCSGNCCYQGICTVASTQSVTEDAIAAIGVFGPVVTLVGICIFYANSKY